ncbi:MAG: RNA polymerase sigma factor [Flavobacteriales bacterium]|nr:RNA polymerase sigma factor [Flavobacteriales bacterium]
MSIDLVEQETMLDRCLAGDRNSQRWLYEKHYGKMLGVCLRYSSDIDQAKDILQDGFIKVFNSLDKFNREGSLEGWIRRIMVNTAIDHIRRDKRSLTLSHSEELLDSGLDITEDPEENENETLQLNMSQVVEAMQELSPGYKAVFNLYVMEDMTHKEIAQALGITEGTSKSNLAKAKMKLRKILLDNKAH